MRNVGREAGLRLYPDVHAPAISTVHAVLDRHGLVNEEGARATRQREPRSPILHSRMTYGAPTTRASPLTISDFASRYLLACEALSTTVEVYAFTVCENVFKE
jgi:putative transposase